MVFCLKKIYRTFFWKNSLHTKYKLHDQLVDFFKSLQGGSRVEKLCDAIAERDFQFQIGHVQSVLKLHTET